MKASKQANSPRLGKARDIVVRVPKLKLNVKITDSYTAGADHEEGERPPLESPEAFFDRITQRKEIRVLLRRLAE